jgi:DNA-binding NarL/FixJ family response regulator
VTVRVLVADDQRIVREGLSLVLGLLGDVEVVGTARDGDEAVVLARSLTPDVVLMDLRMPRCDGVEATRRLAEVLPSTRVLVLTTYADDRSVVTALRAGASGYLTKDAGGAELRRALDRVLEDGVALDPAVAHHVVGALRDDPADEPPPNGLSAREVEVLTLIAEGLSNAEIAARLVIGEATVKSHVNRVLAKTGARDRAQAVVYAYRRGLA